jgi:hypothetical protein
MVALTTAQEYEAVRLALQKLTTTDESIVSFVLDGFQVTYSQSQLEWLQKREVELLRRLSKRNIRKRTQPDFTGGGGTSGAYWP